jgi:hypothetical protein
MNVDVAFRGNMPCVVRNRVRVLASWNLDLVLVN